MNLPLSLSLSLSLSVTARQTNLVQKHAFDAAGGLTRDLSDHFDVPCRTIPQFPAVWIKIETFDSSMQEA